MDKTVEAQAIANKYLETEISNFQSKILSCKDASIKAIWDNLHIELDLLKDCKDDASYSPIHHLLDELLSPDYSLNVKHLSYELLISQLFNARVKAVQVMIKICEGPYSYNFKGENIDLITSLTKFFARAPAIDNWTMRKSKQTQVLVNDLASKVRDKFPYTNLTSLAAEISEMDEMQNSENPIKYDTIRKSYLDDFK
jgi:hypothetical protein